MNDENVPPIEIEIDKHNVVRFRRNKIVEFLLDAGPFDMNQLALMSFSDRDREQFAMLIGYSVSGFGGLSYARPETVALADSEAERLINSEKANQ